MKLFKYLILLCLTLQATPSFTQTQHITPLDQSIIPLKQVRIGMKGYGLTVFQGDKIEPFPVEVVSVMKDNINGPKRAVIWIRCPSERMQKTGPVSGMSGSPIYLWDDDQQHQLGTGGKLAGAFALGYSGSKDCYVGVQPIELMRQVATRADINHDTTKTNNSKSSHLANIQSLNNYAKQQNIDPIHYWRLNAIAQHSTQLNIPDSTNIPNNFQAPPNIQGQPQALKLPLPIQNQQLAEMLTPMLAPLGMQPYYTPSSALIGKPPAEIDAENITIEPGSVICIPLAYGDLDYNASGTVTDILPDGTILAFGHAMYGQGDAALPIASGYIHFIQPGIMGSFKMSGSGAIRGALIRDENSAIVAHADGKFNSASINVTIKRTGQQKQIYNYNVVQHQQLTAQITAVTIIESLMAQRSLPTDNTLKITAKLTFHGNREININTISPMGSPFDIFSQISPPISTMMYNEFESIPLEKATIEIEIIDDINLSLILGGRISKSQLKPGDSLPITVRLQPFGKPVYTKHIQISIPQTLPDGDYQVLVSGPRTYLNLLLKSRPHLSTAYSTDDLLEIWKLVTDVPDNAIFATIQSPDTQSLAIGRNELPALPSSKFTMIASPTDTLATPYAQIISQQTKTDDAISGAINFPITVKREPGR